MAGPADITAESVDAGAGVTGFAGLAARPLPVAASVDSATAESPLGMAPTMLTTPKLWLMVCAWKVMVDPTKIEAGFSALATVLADGSELEP